jgi:hypothetical protein
LIRQRGEKTVCLSWRNGSLDYSKPSLGFSDIPVFFGLIRQCK